jgi:molecular chaperone HscC
LAHLKFHPREALPNVTALSRADALYADLVGDERARLGRSLGAFRAALESQDPERIKVYREQLLSLLLEMSSHRV